MPKPDKPQVSLSWPWNLLAGQGVNSVWDSIPKNKTILELLGIKVNVKDDDTIELKRIRK